MQRIDFAIVFIGILGKRLYFFHEMGHIYSCFYFEVQMFCKKKSKNGEKGCVPKSGTIYKSDGNFFVKLIYSCVSQKFREISRFFL